ncbi:DUF1836 domain-containing protein [Alkalihalobacillus sp. LMS39]|uniref:DUF1836 domain-containing protein n=1 Tax=Alkalihalobacillus sp. LMS39 TaxID=2924032 RepID=UPI001FB3D0BE|nr:DUF1836 domain-containing protein [Alkalihalobacillus sp. LMS39]UOE94970.1 DUF1836 domain-containing protein [Alkalihalobacillus sp. LMS39]
MTNLEEIFKQFQMDDKLLLEDMPNIDLYMDQVIQLFENKFGHSKRYKDDKVLTKTMINNYAKGKLFFPIKNKKYSKEHLILISLIYQLKGGLSINDIRDTFEQTNENIEKDALDIESFYQSYVSVTSNNAERFKQDLEERIKEVEKEVDSFSEEEKVYLEKVLLITSLIHMSNLFRRAAEKVVDDIKKEKQ